MITGNKVVLRHLVESDRQAYHEWINDRELVHYNTTFYPISDSSHNDWFDSITKQQSLIIFSIIVKETESLIGSCSLRNIDHLHKNAELQIRIGASNETGKGLGSESTFLLLCYAFEELNLERVYLYVFSSNERAIKSYRKVGFIEEGSLRRAAFINGEYVNVQVMSVLRDEFKNNIKPSL